MPKGRGSNKRRSKYQKPGDPETFDRAESKLFALYKRAHDRFWKDKK